MRLLSLLKKGKNKRGGTLKGVEIGVIIDNRDPDGLGRVRLNFPWLGNESDWVRIPSLSNDEDCSSHYKPEAGNEVLVAFEHGDPRYPYVIGSLWNGNDEPPETKNEDVKFTRSSREADYPYPAN